MSVFRSSLPPTRRRGKASVLEPYAGELLELYKGFSLREIQKILLEKYEISLSLTSIHRFILRRLEPQYNVITDIAGDLASKSDSPSVIEGVKKVVEPSPPVVSSALGEENISEDYVPPSTEKARRESFSGQYTDSNKKPLI
ncbi:hypothetical protein [Aeromonas sobria]|uniref:hypothetical protein n=1 Tax=Aeromonas sobria TaxID=646 RepID=UPI003F38F8E4